MKWTFNYNSFGGLIRSFRRADKEVEVPVSKGRLKIQTRMKSGKAHYCLRFSSFGQTAYYDMSKDDLLNLSEALLQVAEEAVDLSSPIKST